MQIFKKLPSGSDKGPKVTNPKQAIAIAINSTRKAGGMTTDFSKSKK